MRIIQRKRARRYPPACIPHRRWAHTPESLSLSLSLSRTRPLLAARLLPLRPVSVSVSMSRPRVVRETRRGGGRRRRGGRGVGRHELGRRRDL